MILEFKYQQFIQKGEQDFKCQIDLGMVDFERFVVTSNASTVSERVEEFTIHRTDNKDRIRPNADKRHNPKMDMDTSISVLDLVDDRDFEWLAWNYRTYKFEQMFVSKKDMIFQMFSKTFSFLPS